MTHILETLTQIFDTRGADSYLGEQVTMAEHMLQCADLARDAGASDDLIVAALLHDIGHYSGDFPEDALEQGINNYHDETGAALLRNHFPELVSDCIAMHVEAKRFLCAVEPDYHAALSPASQHSLELQGGSMNADEVEDFQSRRHWQEAVMLRRWDDAAKVPGAACSSFDDYRPLLVTVLATTLARHQHVGMED